MNEQERNGLQLTISHAIQEMKNETGDSFNLEKINLAELERPPVFPGSDSAN